MRWSLIVLVALAACTDEPAPSRAPVVASSDVAPDTSGSALPGAVVGQALYVPAYSHVYSGNRQQPVDLTATLSIRNTDATAPIRLTRIRYAGSEGQVIRSYLEAPRTLGPLASAEFVVNENDRAGGAGASFMVEWTAEGAVSQPVVEAVMISTAYQQGISFVTEGRVVESVGL
ncbi:DUF3124 domain-containing protein [Rubricoccus marinus]|uniref:DUF3124 domain-containing protein n=1 Tax=Rubricoccus marinus TaxID=716817 RepID=A0A259U3A6_9BACT|nr:DUF3124 domain-containing protein [Rubricoccus marinus]OZC04308.1 hypothetical protein BSZ36_15760 [Rubricoccus marinus]